MAIAGAVTRDDRSRSGSDHGGRSRDRAPGAGESQPRSRRRPAVFERSRVEVAPGERVLIVVEHGSDKSALFRAMAGLSPWGAGTIHLPPRDTICSCRRGRISTRCRRGELSRGARTLRPRVRRRRARAGRTLPSAARTRSRGAVGQGSIPRGTAAPGLRAPRAAPAPLGYAGRRAQRPPNGFYDRTLHFRRVERAPPLCPFAPAYVRHGPAPWFGNMTAQTRNCLDRAGMLWAHDSSSERLNGASDRPPLSMEARSRLC